MVKTKTIKKTTKEVKEKVVKKTMNSTNKTFTATVVSAKMQGTVVVAIERKVAHPVYRKLMRATKRLKADTNNMTLVEGDVVVIEQTRPMSKDKNFKVIKKEEVK